MIRLLSCSPERHLSSWPARNTCKTRMFNVKVSAGEGNEVIGTEKRYMYAENFVQLNSPGVFPHQKDEGVWGEQMMSTVYLCTEVLMSSLRVAPTVCDL